MPIRRRVTSERNKKTTRLRHPLLAHGKVTAIVYNFIKANPGSNFRDVKHLTSSAQPITDLFNEGLIRPINTEKRPYKYEAVPENESGARRDKVAVRVIVFANRYGEFSIRADMIGQKPTAHEDFPQEVAMKEFVIDIPSPNDPYAIRPIVDINELVDQVFLPQEAEPYIPSKLTIEGDFTIIDPE